MLVHLYNFDSLNEQNLPFLTNLSSNNLSVMRIAYITSSDTCLKSKNQAYSSDGQYYPFVKSFHKSRHLYLLIPVLDWTQSWYACWYYILYSSLFNTILMWDTLTNISKNQNKCWNIKNVWIFWVIFNLFVDND